MKIESKKMFDLDGNRVQLIEFLNKVDSNNYNWAILDFVGIGKAPNDLSMDEFEDAIRANPTGYKIEWDELISFAQKLELTVECLIVAVEHDVTLIKNELANDDFSSCKIIIQAFDSTEWRFQM